MQTSAVSFRCALLLALAGFAAAAAPAGAQHGEHMGARTGSGSSLPLGIPFERAGSGTSWLPDSSSSPMVHQAVGDWTLMLHGVGYGQYDRQGTIHGDQQLGLADWEMATAAHALGDGLLRVDAATSLEPSVLGARGYPELLQSGGTFDGARLANRQHPNALVMAFAASYEHSLTSELATSVYVAAVGEPALGPVDYMHRPSAAVDPFAPIGHHWQDATCAANGVVTGGLYSHLVKLEGSIFNAREPLGTLYGVDYAGARLDSYAARLTVLPTGRVAASAWAGYLYDDDPLDPGLGMQRYGVSLLTETRGLDGGAWSSTMVWGIDIHHHGSREHEHDPGVAIQTRHPSSSFLIESTLDIGSALAVYGRAEQVEKTADDLGFLGGDLMQHFTVRSLVAGAVRDLESVGWATFGVGARASVDLVPQTLRLTYGTRTPTGFALFVRARIGNKQ